MGDYKAQLLHAVSEVHERVREYKERVRGKMEMEYDRRNKVIEKSDNAAVVSRIGENVETIRVQFNMLRVVPSYIPDDRVDTVTNKDMQTSVQVKKKVTGIVCNEGCLKDVKLEELKGIQLPGALSKKPLGTLWNAWQIASIFIRTDIEMPTASAWTGWSVCVKRHEKIEDYGFVDKTYDAALKKVKKEIEEDERAMRPIGEESTAFAAPASAALLEKDCPKRGISTRIAPAFSQLRQILNGWSAYAVWVVVWPLEPKFEEDEVTEVVKACERHFENDGRIVSAWPPVVAKNPEVWKKMIGIWKLLDATLKKRAGSGQFFRAANSKTEERKIFIELRVP
uniref:ALOG domain-containing protein n=1 Tax=Haemonchus contortus TaxID=6289 RepID=A0A7I4Z2S9_HAECO